MAVRDLPERHALKQTPHVRSADGTVTTGHLWKHLRKDQADAAAREPSALSSHLGFGAIEERQELFHRKATTPTDKKSLGVSVEQGLIRL